MGMYLDYALPTIVLDNLAVVYTASDAGGPHMASASGSTRSNRGSDGARAHVELSGGWTYLGLPA